MTSYLFVFGRTPALSALELGALTASHTLLGTSVARVGGDALLFPIDDAFAILGGTVKIAHVLGSVPAVTAESLVPFLPQQTGRVTFGISVYNSDKPVPQQVLSRLKEVLEQRGTSARYVTGKDAALTSVVVEKKHVHELVLVPQNGTWTVGQTIGVQPFEEWSSRDYDRPHSDAKSGMLPPKVARMIVNIALGPQARDKVLYDPFCGMGTILAEALLRGARVRGSDQSASVIEKTKANCAWLQSRYPHVSCQLEDIFVCDATNVSSYIPKESIDAIVTEPFMGSSTIARKSFASARTGEVVKNTIRGLEKLYIGCLRDWHSVLKNNGLVIIALPLYAIGEREFFVKRVIDTLDRLGYTTLTGPIEYSRPQAVVRRRFFILQKINSTNTTNLQISK